MKAHQRTNPYLRAAKANPIIRQQAAQKLEVRLSETASEAMEAGNGALVERPLTNDSSTPTTD